MTAPLIFVDRQNPSITILTLNRPEKRNALNIALLDEFCKIYEETEQLPDQRIIIINATGPVFCAGLDLSEAADLNTVERSARLLAQLFTTIYNSSIVSIVAVQGIALAGGAGLTAACDIALASETVQFGFPEVQRGLVPALVSTLLRRQLSPRPLRALLLTGELITAQRAYEIGLINRVVKPEELMSEAFNLAKVILKGMPQAVAQTKRLLIDLELISLSDDLKIAMDAHRRARLSEEANGNWGQA